MRYSILTSFAFTMFTCMGTAGADIFTTETSTEIQNTLKSCGNTPACRSLLVAKSACDTGNNDNIGDLTTCYGQALKDYHKSISVAATDEPYEGQTIPVSTNTADSLYEHPADGDQKGFLQSREN